MQQIGLITEKYQISHRTLHYWETAGIIKSVRAENGYRTYDAKNEEKIRRIIALKKLELPLKDIELICRAAKVEDVISILKDHYLNIMHQSHSSYLLSQTLKKLISDLGTHSKVDDVFVSLHESKEDIPPSLKGELSMEETIKEKELRIVMLPRMIVASISKGGNDPEDNCWKEAFRLIKEYRLDEEVGFRNLGFGYNDEEGHYIYELWITIPQAMIPPKPFRRIEFKGGLYATIPTYLSNIGEDWQALHDLVVKSSHYEHDTDALRNMCLEECLDLVTFHNPNTPLSERQLDLLLPIKRVEHEEKALTFSILNREETIESIRLAGSYFVLREATRPWKKRVPWYQLAQNIYKVGPTIQECMDHGNNTWTIVYGRTPNQVPFYLDADKGKVERVFAAVQMSKPFPTYPEGLEEMMLTQVKCMVFTSQINPTFAKSTKLDFKPLYEAAILYFKGREHLTLKEYCLERDYRQDGRYVDKLELYIPIN